MSDQEGLADPTAGTPGTESPSVLMADGTASDSTAAEPEFGDLDAQEFVGSSSSLLKQDVRERRIVAKDKLNNFLWTTSPQPHSVRRRMILAKHPEIEKLYGADPLQAIPCVLTILVQIYISYWVSKYNLSWFPLVVLTFVVSGTLNHSLFAAMHETSHRTIFESKYGSELLGIATTIPMGLPAAIPFKRYHLDHHIFMGVDGLDPDIPTKWEGRFFRSTLLKLLWVLILPATYSLRPMITRPKPLRRMDVFNWIVCASIDLSILYFWGVKSVFYLLGGTLFSMNFHPFAGHFISEHFIFPEENPYQETTSYYGPWNALTYNVGLHNEHHDFPRVAGSCLGLVRAAAPEFYDMPAHKGWGRVLWRFILTPSMTPFNRVKRTQIKGGKLEAENEEMKLHECDVPYGGAHSFWPSLDESNTTPVKGAPLPSTQAATPVSQK